MTVNATRLQNARRLPSIVEASPAASRLGRHHVSPASNSLTSELRLELLPSRHPNRSVKDLDIVKTVVAVPTEDFGIEVLELISRRVPVEGVEPAPAPVALHRNQQRQPGERSDDR